MIAVNDETLLNRPAWLPQIFWYNSYGLCGYIFLCKCSSVSGNIYDCLRDVHRIQVGQTQLTIARKAFCCLTYKGCEFLLQLITQMGRKVKVEPRKKKVGKWRSLVRAGERKREKGRKLNERRGRRGKNWCCRVCAGVC